MGPLKYISTVKLPKNKPAKCFYSLRHAPENSLPAA